MLKFPHEKLGLIVLKSDVTVKLNGINSEETYTTKIVELLLFAQRSIEAICLPKILTKLDKPNLANEALKFQEKCYKIADNLLHTSNAIKDVDFILGNNVGHLIPQREVPFGLDRTSIFVETPIGVMLIVIMVA